MPRKNDHVEIEYASGAYYVGQVDEEGKRHGFGVLHNKSTRYGEIRAMAAITFVSAPLSETWT
jgi:hypothetical protein